MDNQFYQPGNGPFQPGMGQPDGGYAPNGYPGAPGNPAAPVNPYGVPQGNPYDGMSQSYVPPQGNPYDGMSQSYVPPQGNPYDGMSQSYVPPQGNPYDGMSQSYVPPQGNPYDGMSQSYVPPQGMPYGGVQQPYSDPGAQQQPYSDDGYQHLFNQQGMPEQPPQAEAQGEAEPQPVQRRMGRPVTGAKAPELRGAKRGLTLSDIALIVVALLAVAGFAGWYLYASYAPEVAHFGKVATGSLSAIHGGSVLIVRNEIPYDVEGVNAIDYVAEEGSRVDRSTVICYVYSSGYSASAVRQLQEYRDKIRDYQEGLLEGSAVYDARSDNFNKNIMTLALEIRAIMEGDEGSLPNIEKQMTAVVADRQLYYDQKYAPDQRFSRMKDDERSQTQRINSWMMPLKGTTDALVSFYSDGYEYAINGSNYVNFEPHQVRAMINGARPDGAAPSKGRTTIYRMIKDNEWYALFLSRDTEWTPVVGETYELQLERFGDTPVQASVVSFTKSGGELLVRLRIVGSVAQVLYLRSCDALLSESMTTLMVNERGIYMQDEMTGVVVIEGTTESFIPVNVIHTVDGYAYFQTVQQGILFGGEEIRLFN